MEVHSQKLGTKALILHCINEHKSDEVNLLEEKEIC